MQLRASPGHTKTRRPASGLTLKTDDQGVKDSWRSGVTCVQTFCLSGVACALLMAWWRSLYTWKESFECDFVAAPLCVFWRAVACRLAFAVCLKECWEFRVNIFCCPLQPPLQFWWTHMHVLHKRKCLTCINFTTFPFVVSSAFSQKARFSLVLWMIVFSSYKLEGPMRARERVCLWSIQRRVILKCALWAFFLSFLCFGGEKKTFQRHLGVVISKMSLPSLS